MPGHKYLVSLIALFICSGAVAQNLIPNGDFEGMKGKRSALPWSFINTVDYFTLSKSSSDNSKKDDKNQLGRQPHSGKAYIGLRIWSLYREYIQVKLEAPLKEGKKYSFKMYVAVSPWCNSIATGIGANFSVKGLPLVNNKAMSKVHPQVRKTLPRSCKDSANWMLVSDTFTAKGGEKFLAIGYFGNRSKTQLQKRKRWKPTLVREAYYYIDDVSLYEVDDNGKEIIQRPLTRADIQKLPVDTVGNYLEKQARTSSTIVMKNIYFASGRADLLAESYEELGLLVELLNSQPGIDIEVVGHTDNTGKEEENKKLSFARAGAVVKYLVDNGIDPRRLTYSGKGSDEPITTNDTEEGRRQNRRVEFRIEKKQE